MFKKTDNLNDAMEHFYNRYTDGPVAIIAMEDKQRLIQPVNARFRSTQMTMDRQRKEIDNEGTGRGKVMICQLGRPYGGDSDTGRVLPIQKQNVGFHITNEYLTKDIKLVKERMTDIVFKSIDKTTNKGKEA